MLQYRFCPNDFFFFTSVCRVSFCSMEAGVCAEVLSVKNRRQTVAASKRFVISVFTVMDYCCKYSSISAVMSPSVMLEPTLRYSSISRAMSFTVINVFVMRILSKAMIFSDPSDV